MNVRLLRRIANVIQEKPREFDMRTWHGERVGRSNEPIIGRKASILDCDTTHCIAGWAHVLSGEVGEYDCVRVKAEVALGLTNEQSNRLFYAQNWPKGFGGYRATPAKAAARIEHFIKTKGAE